MSRNSTKKLIFGRFERLYRKKLRGIEGDFQHVAVLPGFGTRKSFFKAEKQKTVFLTVQTYSGNKKPYILCTT